MKLETRNAELETAKAYSRIAFGATVDFSEYVCCTDSQQICKTILMTQSDGRNWNTRRRQIPPE